MTVPGNLSSPLLATATAAAADTAYVIPKSLRFNSGDSAHLSKTFASAGNRRTWTWSGWVKRSKLGANQRILRVDSSGEAGFQFRDTDKIELYDYANGGYTWQLQTDQVFRDCSSFYHLVVAFDTTQSTAADRVSLYVNGSEVTTFSTSNYPSQNFEGKINLNAGHSIAGQDSLKYDGLMADIQFVDGQALLPTDLAETRSSDGVWVPKEYTFGTNPNNGTTWSTGASVGQGSFLVPGSSAFNGNLSNSAAPYDTAGGGGSNPSLTLDFSSFGGIAYTSSVRVYRSNGQASNHTISFNGGTPVNHPWFQWFTVATGSGTLNSLTSVNNNSSNTTGIAAVEVDGFVLIDGARDNSFHLNFSDSSTNEALGFDSAPTIPDLDPKKGFDVVTYAGTGATQSIGGFNFEPGLVWIKEKSSTSDHGLWNTVVGSGAYLSSNLSASQYTTGTEFVSFDPGGFTVGASTMTNHSGQTNVAWCWRAGGPAVTNTDGTITTQVSANTDYGFSVIKYTGVDNSSAQTIGHGLGKVPKLVLIKNLTDSEDWAVYHASLGNTKYLQLNSAGGAATSSAYWNDTDPTSSLITLNNSNDVQRISRDYTVYAWSEIPGFSKFGSYTGNGSDDGPFIETGFKPRWILIKSTSASNANSHSHWLIYDTERSPSNEADDLLLASGSNAEFSGTNTGIDILDNGFKLKADTGGYANFNTNQYIYAAFADRPGNNWDVNNIVTNEGLTTSRDNFDVVEYTGNGSSGRNIEGLSFTPDFVWAKNTTNTGGYNHILVDSVRGAGKYLTSSAANAESTFGYISALNSGGFTVSNHTEINGSSNGYVAWAWKAGGTAVSNTDGSITSSVSANAQYGFSIVSYTGTGSAATVGHGLNGKVPELIIVKNRDKTYNWAVWSSQLSSNAHYLFLNGTDSESNSYYTYWNNTAPTGSVFSIGANSPDTAVNVNESGDDMVAYCFANVPGYQRINSYTGTGASGNTIVTGFRPAFVLIRGSSHGGDWTIYDAARGNDNYLSPNKTDAEENYSTKDFTFTNNGFILEGNDNSVNASGRTYVYLAIGDDEIGSDEDCLVDVPNAVTADADATDTTGGYQRGNYATWNPLDTKLVQSNGNLDATASTSQTWVTGRGTMAMTSGKFYWEVTINSLSTTSDTAVQLGIGALTAALPSNDGAADSNAYVYLNSNGQKMSGGSAASYGSSYTTGDVIGVAFDADNGTLAFYKNGTSQGTAYSSFDTDKQYAPLVSLGRSSTSTSISANFGQMQFKYGIPTGHSALNTTALPAATIADGSAQFDVATYSGNGGTQTISGLNFAGDLFWFKSRSATHDHWLFDSVRGLTEAMYSNGTSPGYDYTPNGVSATSDTGFTLTSSGQQFNANSATYVGWVWNASANSNKTYTVKVVSDSGNKYRFDDFGTSAVTLNLAEGSTYIFDQSDSSNAGHPIRFGTSSNGTDYTTGVTHTGTPGSAGAKTTLVLGTGVATLYYSCANHSGMGGQINTNSTGGASNFDGSIQATVKANPETGFSICKWTGSNTNGYTVGHGLNAKPDLMIFKNTDAAFNWHVYHSALGATKVLRLNLTNAELDDAGFLNDTEPTSSVFTTGSFGVWDSDKDTVGYIFSAVAGYSAMGSYVGGSSPFVYTGFKPRFVLAKNVSGSFNWFIADSERGTSNPFDELLYPNESIAETTSGSSDNIIFNSNGFTIEGSGNTVNQSGSTFIYLAIAEHPFSANGGLAR
nr:lectin-like protein [uncultured Mediterranean phage uvMED]